MLKNWNEVLSDASFVGLVYLTYVWKHSFRFHFRYSKKCLNSSWSPLIVSCSIKYNWSIRTIFYLNSSPLDCFWIGFRGINKGIWPRNKCLGAWRPILGNFRRRWPSDEWADCLTLLASKPRTEVTNRILFIPSRKNWKRRKYFFVDFIQWFCIKYNFFVRFQMGI